MNHWLILLLALIMAPPIHGKCRPCTSRALKAVVSSVNDFDARFNEVVAQEVAGNYICSPFSVDVVLSMATYGADGETKLELQQSLHMQSETLAKDGFRALIDFLNNIEGVELAVANKLFIAIGFEVKDTFKDITRTYFRSEIESVDFSNPVSAAAVINNWAATNTNDRIKDVLSSDDLDSNTALLMANAVYFKGTWASPFNPNSTQLRPFHVDENVTKDVDMMYQEAYYNWGELKGHDAKYIQLPYKNENVSMFVFLPDGIGGLRKIEENLHNINLTELEGYRSNVELFMPKFKVETTLDLMEILQKLNIRDMFEDSANFSRISDSVSLKVSKAVQKAFIEVNEKGSEAAAVTVIGAVPTSAILGPTPQFVINKPFLCAIAVKDNGIIQLFNARVVDPTTSNN